MTTNINTPGQYLSKEDLLKYIPDVKITPQELGSTDTYHENKLLETYRSLDKTGQVLVYKAAIQLGVIGYGNKNYGFIRLDEKNIITLVDLFHKYGIKYQETQNSKYNDNELSARRLLRLFRYQIQKFIIENNRPSYLWNKYADKSNLKFMGICFPTAEHIVETQEEAIFLLHTYGNLDATQNTRFRSRLKRVFIARGVLSPEYFIDKNY
jgi:hypothetical protein